MELEFNHHHIKLRHLREVIFSCHDPSNAFDVLSNLVEGGGLHYMFEASLRLEYDQTSVFQKEFTKVMLLLLTVPSRKWKFWKSLNILWRSRDIGWENILEAPGVTELLIKYSLWRK